MKQKNAVTEQTLKAVCREFNISEEWLRTGQGEICKLVKTDDYSAIATIIGEKTLKPSRLLLSIIGNYRIQIKNYFGTL